MSFTYSFKFIIIGDTGVGKSCILLRFSDNEFRERTGMTIGVEFGTRTIVIDDKSIKLQIWDTAGQESFASITRSYYRGAAGALLVYDVTKRQSFNHVKIWMDEAKRNAPSTLVSILVGNKSDLDRKRAVSYKEGEEFAKEHGMLFIETSAKSAENIDTAFTEVSKIVCNMIQDGSIDLNTKEKDFGIKRGLGFGEGAESSESSGCCYG